MATPHHTYAMEVLRSLSKSRWMVALASFFLMVSSGGALNTFSLFSQHLKLSLEYNQQEMNTISFFKDMGTSIGIFSGFVYSFTGPWLVLMLGCGLNLCGYLMIWLAATQRIARPEVWQMCAYICLVGASAAFTTTAVLVACAKNFPRNQSMILSLLDSTQGLSGAIFALLYQAFFVNRTNSFILLLAWFPALLCLLFMFVIRSLPPVGKYHDTRILYIFLSATLGLAGYLMLVIILQHFVKMEISVVKVIFSVAVLILCIPVAVVLKSELKNAAYAKKHLWFHTELAPLSLNVRYGNAVSVSITAAEKDISQSKGTQSAEEKEIDSLTNGHSPSSQQQLPSSGGLEQEPPVTTSKGSPQNRGDDFTIFEAIFSVDMCLIFIATTCGVGAVITVTNNLGQIGASLGYKESGTNTFIALQSIWDFVGGVSCGFLSDIFLVRYGIARPFFFSLVLLLLAIGNLVIALAIPGALFLGSILVGLSIGGQWSVLYTMIAELFGLKFYGTLQNITYVAKALGTYILSVRIAGILYDREGRKEANGVTSPAPVPAGADQMLCSGSHCYRTTFFIMAAACLFSCFVALVLSIRTIKFYKLTVRKRLGCSKTETPVDVN
ncbi:hypothetical protein O6H91_02G073200 [Diphasiastrum complanatum]|uniref:Uncharacterized protein n=1 Tax=Diphasiastrum complanatum TaxID=34168 RepID=A0ACC2EGZ2_DIPCM|nr:hypothetical protein O6H91_02G073200 [Diphasiastrum complanatum]